MVINHKTIPRLDRYYIVDFKKVDKPYLLKYHFNNQELAYIAIVNNLGNDTKRYNIIEGKTARKHKIGFKRSSRQGEGRIWPDRKYNYPINESLTTAQKKNFRNKQKQKAYLERKQKKYEDFTKNNPSYIESKSRWYNLRDSRRLRKSRERSIITK